MDVALARLDDGISVSDGDDLPAQPQRRAANEQERHLLGSKDGRGGRCRREDDQ
jgi:hypothetical protein